MERNHTKAINVDLLLEQITTEDNRLAFHRLFELYYPALCMYAKRFITDKETREDIVQDVFFAIWENRSRISVKTSARSYLVTCARNHCLNYGSPDKPGGLSIQLCKSEKKEFYIRYSS